MRKFSLSSALLVFVLGTFSCSAGLEEKLVGAWQGSDYLFQKTGGPDIVVTVNGGIEQHLRSKLILEEDGSFQRLVGEYDNGKGTWSVQDDQLIARNESGEEVNYTLIKVSDHELITLHGVELETPSGVLKGKIRLSYTR
uniref:hypothetical protein n=1 Tax=Algoriphagus locisalis TaxID=305507 RepID=UPI001113F851|nr:hypothetical protein [Algoriphagus locisalis]